MAVVEDTKHSEVAYLVVLSRATYPIAHSSMASCCAGAATVVVVVAGVPGLVAASGEQHGSAKCAALLLAKAPMPATHEVRRTAASLMLLESLLLQKSRGAETHSVGENATTELVGNIGNAEGIELVAVVGGDTVGGLVADDAVAEQGASSRFRQCTELMPAAEQSGC